MDTRTELFSLEQVSKHFPVSGGTLKAVDNLSLKLYQGEAFGLVGESGCGKSTLGRLLVRLYQPTTGSIRFHGKNVSRLRRKEAKDYAFHVQMVFQESYSSLDPRMTIGDSIKEGMRIHHMGTEQEIDERMYELLHLVGLNQEHASRFPYEFSGGQRQRAGIARALAVNPEFLVCDEPISALDVSIQAQIINLLKKLQTELGLSYLFISHDLSAVKYLTNRIGVMYLGSLVEVADTESLYLSPIHPYTQALLSAIPKADPDVENTRERIVLEGDVPSPVNMGAGCKFCSRCKYCTEQCRKETPQLREIGQNHYVACCRAEELYNFE